jgi:hypothetical protein
MKTLLTISILVFTIMFSSTSFAGWTKVGTHRGNTVYVDVDTIRKHGGYIYFRNMYDYLKRNRWGYSSTITYYQGDCKSFGFKVLSDSFYKEHMARGTPSHTSNRRQKEWYYGGTGSSPGLSLKSICNR